MKGREVLFCLVKYPWQLLSQLLEQDTAMFLCNSAEDHQRSYTRLRSTLRALLQEYVRPERKNGCLMDSLMLQLLHELSEHFQATEGESDQLGGDLRLQRIIQFVNQSYQHNLSLSKMAGELQISTSTLSRFFKKKTGYYFVDYVNRIRVQAAMEELTGTDKNITMIAVNSGFSNLTVFNRVFREINGCTPSEYRRSHREGGEARRQRQLMATEELRAHLQPGSGRSSRPSALRQERIRCDGLTGERCSKDWISAVNIGPANQMTQSELQAHLLYLKEHLHIQYARIWNIFAAGLMITDGQKVSVFSFDQLDDVLDFLVLNHITPYLDLGNRANTINLNEHDVVYTELDTVRFRSRRVWEHAIRSLIRHVAKRYGKEEVSRWIFELTYCPGASSEPPLYSYEEGESVYADAFQFLYQVVREYVPRARVGGWGGIPDFRPDLQRQELEELLRRGCPPDFFSIMVYPYTSPQDAFVPLRSRETRWEEQLVSGARAMLDRAGLAQCSLWICEWNCSVSNRNYLNDSCYRSAYIAQQVSRLWGSTELMAISIGSDWVGNHYDSFRVVNGNMGLLSQFHIRKPAFFAMQFLHALGPYLIHRDEHCIITRTDHFSFYILCFNRKPLGEQYYLRNEDKTSPGQVDSLFEDREPLQLELELTGLPADQVYTVKRRSINTQEGSILPEWGRFRYEAQLEDSDKKYLRETCFPRMSMERLTVQQGCLSIRELLQPNEVTLLHIYRHNGG